MDRTRRTWSDLLGPILVLPFLAAQTWANFETSLCLGFQHHTKKNDINSYHGSIIVIQASLLVHLVKNLPARQETQVQSLGGKDLLEKGMATHSTVLAGEFHGQRSLAGYSPWGCKESGTTSLDLGFLHL